MLIERVEEWDREIERRGLLHGQRDLVLRQLETKFGQIDAGTKARIEAARSKSLLKWGTRLISAERLADVFAR